MGSSEPAAQACRAMGLSIVLPTTPAVVAPLTNVLLFIFIVSSLFCGFQ